MALAKTVRTCETEMKQNQNVNENRGFVFVLFFFFEQWTICFVLLIHCMVVKYDACIVFIVLWVIVVVNRNW